MGDDKRTRNVVIATCALAILALLVIATWRLDRAMAPGDDPPPRERTAPPVARTVRMDAAAIEHALDVADPRLSAPADAVVRSAAGLRGNPARFFGPDAYPAEALRANEQGRTVAQLTVDTGGIPRACTILTSSGSRSLDAATCSIALGRVTYTPARDTTGRPIASKTTLPVRWVLPR